MTKLIILYKLKPGKIEDYRKWSRERDQKITPDQPGVNSFQVFELGPNSKYDIAELVDVDNPDNFPPKTEAMNKIVAEWESYGDPATLIALSGKQIM